jgi:hypothetical protein
MQLRAREEESQYLLLAILMENVANQLLSFPMNAYQTLTDPIGAL